MTVPYHVGRKKGDWWKWKLDPLSIDAVMVYAQAGHGRRANLYTDFTFAVWKDKDLVPFAKAYSGLTDAEFRKITHWVRRNTLARFGPVRQVPPEQVFEIGFEGIQASPRHKSGVALRFPPDAALAPRQARPGGGHPRAPAGNAAALRVIRDPVDPFARRHVQVIAGLDPAIHRPIRTDLWTGGLPDQVRQ